MVQLRRLWAALRARRERARAVSEWREPWQREVCRRCGSFHPRHCDLCPNDPPCADHECSWAGEWDENDVRL